MLGLLRGIQRGMEPSTVHKAEVLAELLDASTSLPEQPVGSEVVILPSNLKECARKLARSNILIP